MLDLHKLHAFVVVVEEKKISRMQQTDYLFNSRL